MVLPQQGCAQALFVSRARQDGPVSSTHASASGNGKWRRLAVIAGAVSSLLFLPHALAIEHTESAAFHRMTEEDLSGVHARGFHDRYFDKIARYLAHGVAVEVLGDTGLLLNPLPSLLEADITFRDVVFNPNSPWMVSDSNGNAYIRIPQSIGELSIRNIRIAGSKGASFGSVTIRDIDFTGTIIRVTKR
ncbi:MAG TPA: hypothetical protein VGE12_13555 [Noviherbaspirillum sp.]